MKSVAENLSAIEVEVQKACERVGRIRTSVRVVAVSKRQSLDVLNAALSLGLRDFAENYWQEAAEKQQALSSQEMNWHFIGSIQTNKLKNIVGSFEWIHSVDRLKVAAEIDRLCEERGARQKVLLQVNLAGEDSKSGINPDEVFDFFSEVKPLKSLDWRGLMLMPPFVDNPEDNREFFQLGKQMLMDLCRKHAWLSPEEFCELSMGTSQDYRVAIEEGATMIRLGEKLLGKRVV